MDILQAIVLGAIQGLGEFIPISSSAHLILARWLLGWEEPGLSFDVALHLGTLFAVLVYFWRDFLRLGSAWAAGFFSLKWETADGRLAWLILIGCVPGGIIGYLAEGAVEEYFHSGNGADAAQRTTSMVLIGIVIALLGIILYFSDRIGQRTKETAHISWVDSVLIGLAQAVAVVPGVSRSGATITMGLFMGLKRETAARFSFLLGTPIIAGAAAKQAYGIIKTGVPGNEWSLFFIGMLTAAIVGYICIAFLLRYLQQNSTAIFVNYRLALGIFVVLVAFVRG